MDKSLQNKITIIIKTFVRKKSLTNLLRSLRRLNCELPILIADDSEQPYKEEILSQFSDLDIQYYCLPFDTGLAAGRNFLLSKVQTPFFLLCDDDFVLDQQADLQRALIAMKQNDLDICGGIVLNYITIGSIRNLIRVMITPSTAYRFIANKPFVSRYAGHFIIEKEDCKLLFSNQHPGTNVFACDIVNNFFVAKTSSILNMQGWDSTYIMGEHEEFFIRAKMKGLKVASLEGFATRHYPLVTRSYIKFRDRSRIMKENYVKKFGFISYQEINRDNGTVMFSYNTGTI